MGVGVRVRVRVRASQQQQQQRRRGNGADDASWERGWSGYRSVSAPRPMTKENGRRQQSRDAGSRRRREGEEEEDARWARRGGDKDSAQKTTRGGHGNDDGWRRRVSGFEALGLSSETVRALEIEGLGRPTRIQALAFEHIVEGRSAAVLAETGSGKTYAYSLPLLARFERQRRRMRGGVSCRVSPAVLVLVPTEELATQAGMMVSKVAAWILPDDVLTSVLTGKSKKLLRPRRETAKLLGSSSKQRKRKDGRSEEVESGRRALEGSHVIVATPNWALRLAESGYMVSDRLQAIVLDEADEMLSAGFQESVLRLTRTLIGAAAVSAKRQKAAYGDVQVVLAAATMPRSLAAGLEAMLGSKLVRIASGGLHRAPRGLRHEFVHVVENSTPAHGDARGAASGDGGGGGNDDLHSVVVAADSESSSSSLPTRGDALAAVLDAAVTRGNEQVLVFVNSPEECEAVASAVEALGMSVISFHGRGKRSAGALDAFSLGGVSVLVSTDVAARGIDFSLLRYVVQYRPATSVKMHVHRVGRTARAGQRGPFFAYTLYGDTEAGVVDECRAWASLDAATTTSTTTS